ncbi:MAG: hypothetical protein OEZ43_15185 [Gammaproteobacteria bacterium]|nr:hypothetical protein [Gammaproteobacteria bacterium]
MRLAVKDGPISYVDQHNGGTNFLALREMFSRLPGGRPIKVLDLGMAWNSNIQFFSNFRAHLFVEDLFRWKTRMESKKTGQSITDLLQPYPQGLQFDVILFWDLFDYLSNKELEALIQHLTPFCKRGTLMFFVTSTLEKIPSQPAIFKIIDAEHLLYETTTSAVSQGRQHRQAGIQRLLPGFRLVRAFRMSNGMEEYLYIYE